MRRGLCCWVSCALILVAAAATPAQAQTPTGTLSTRDLLRAFIVTRLNPSVETEQKFLERRENFVNAIGNAIALGITTAPVGGSSAGLAMLINPITGTSSLKSDSFGPLFLDRPLTSGRGVVGFGFTFNHTSFDRFQGIDLQTKGINTFDNRVTYTNSNYQQFIKEYLTLEPSVSVFTAYASYGVTDHLDVGVIVPFASLNMSGRLYWDYDIGKTYPVVPADQLFFPGPTGTNFEQARASASASGLGDMTVRATYAFGAQQGQGVAVTGAVRLPTGDEENLLGTGEASGIIRVSASKKITESVSLYGNGGYGFGGLSDEINYGFGVDAVFLEKKSLTLTFELLGLNLTDSVNGIGHDTLGPLSQPDPRFTPPEPTIYSADRPFFTPGSVNMLRGVGGAKYLLGHGALLSGGVIFPLTDTGLRAGTTAFVGIDVSIIKARK